MTTPACVLRIQSLPLAGQLARWDRIPAGARWSEHAVLRGCGHPVPRRGRRVTARLSGPLRLAEATLVACAILRNGRPETVDSQGSPWACALSLFCTTPGVGQRGDIPAVDRAPERQLEPARQRVLAHIHPCTD